ncbi:hypothetical protein D3C72_2439110 [compost metagenome]
MFFGNSHQFRHGGELTIEMHWQNCFGTGGYGSTNDLRIEVIGIRIGLNQYRHQIILGDG